MPPLSQRVCQRISPSRGKGKKTRRESTTNEERENNILAAILTAPYANPGHPVCSIREPENRRHRRRSLLRLKLRLSRVRFASAHASQYMFSHTYTDDSFATLVRYAHFLVYDRVACRVRDVFRHDSEPSRRKLTVTGDTHSGGSSIQ